MKKKDFTFAELLGLIAVIAFLLAIIIPSINNAREPVKRVLCSNQFKGIGTGLTMHAGDYDNFMPFYGGQVPIYPTPFDGTPPKERRYTLCRNLH